MEVAMTQDRMLTLFFVDGTKLSFDFPEQTKIAAGKQLRLEEFLKGHHLLVEADGSLLIFPVANIKYLQLSSAAATVDPGVKLPNAAIRGATIVS
jgi:hypothetical protein